MVSRQQTLDTISYMKYIYDYMMTIPLIANVAELQRGYRSLVEKIKKTGGPLVIVNNGEADVVVVDVKTYNKQAQRLQELEEDEILRLSREAIREYKAGKSIKMKENETLLEYLKRTDKD